MVLLAMLVPMALLLRSYALEDRLSRGRAGGAGDRDGRVRRRTTGRGRGLRRPDQPGRRHRHRPCSTPAGPVDRLGPGPRRGRPGPRRAQHRPGPASTTSTGGVAVPGARSRWAAAPRRPEQTPGDPGRRRTSRAGPTSGDRAQPGWCCWPSALALLAGALVARRPPRPLVRAADPPARRRTRSTLGRPRADPGRGEPSGPPEVRDLPARDEPPRRPDRGAAGARAGGRRRPLAPAAHADHRAAAAGRGPVRRPGPRPARPATSTSSRRWSTTSSARPGAPSARAWCPRTDGVARAHRAGALLGAAGRGPGPRLRRSPRR